MKKFVIIIVLTLCVKSAMGQFYLDYQPEAQSTESMQYFSPVEKGLAVGDCIPYFHDGTYYLYWLLDSANHGALNGLGGHQWTLSTTEDLKEWKHYPVVLGIDEEWEKSICTGSVDFDGENHYAFYATRLLDENGDVNEQLSFAVSKDAVHFEKQEPNPFYKSAPGYSKRNFRDPKVIIDDDGVFNLLISSEKEEYTVDENRGALVHLSSRDLKTWKVNEPIITGQRHVPECPDYFLWNGWYYLVYGIAGKTYYVMSQNKWGPWTEPRSQAFVEDWSNVLKTAEFTEGRRIAASWIPQRRDNKDYGQEIFGGNALFREVIQLEDGTLGTKFPEEMIPRTGGELSAEFVLSDNASRKTDKDYSIEALGSIGSLYASGIPVNCRITFEVIPEGPNEEVGVYLRATEKASEGYKLGFSANRESVLLENTTIESVSGLEGSFKVDIVMKDDIIDVCINGQRCIANRLYEKKGDGLWLYAKHGKATFRNVSISPIIR